jgi:hypothetical protein
MERAIDALGGRTADNDPARASIADFILEGLCAMKKISRTDEGRLYAQPQAAKPHPRDERRTLEQLMEEDETPVKGKKKYYN